MKYSIFTIVVLLFLQTTLLAAEQVSFASSSTYYGKKVTLTGALGLSDKAGKQPIVILLHGCGGIWGAANISLHSHAGTLNKSGFATLIIDSFRPREIDFDWVCQLISRLTAAQGYRQRDVVDAIRFLGTLPDIDASNVFVMGQSNGGSVASLMSYGKNSELIRAAVAYYPWCGAVPYTPLIPLLVFTGEKDDWTPADECLVRQGGSDKLTVKNYPNTYHSFDLPIPKITFLGYNLEGNPAATADSAARMIDFFLKNLKKEN